MKVALCKVEEIPEHGTKLIDFFGREAHIYRVNGIPRAVMNTCMHFGGPLEFDNCEFACPWHGAKFSAEDGHRLEGPAPSQSRLMFLSTRVENDELMYVWGE